MMGGSALARQVGDASQSAGGVVQHARDIGRKFGEDRAGSVKRSVEDARDSLRSLAAYGRTLNPAFSVPMPLAGSPAEQLSLEAQFRAAARGAERPQRVYTDLSAARSYPATAGTMTARRAAALEGGAGEVRRWFTASYLGEPFAGRFVRSPPLLTAERREAFVRGGGQYANGMYSPGTNIVSLNADSLSLDADGRNSMAHEMLHYASAGLGGGWSMRWRDAQGRPEMRWRVAWLDEGLTELHAQQLTRSHGHTPTYVAYAPETTLAFYLQQLAGAAVLRSAYLSGDYTEVRRQVDRQLGGGAFAAIMDAGSGVGGMVVVRERMARRGLSASLATWDQNALVRLAGAAEEYRRDEQERREAEREPGPIQRTAEGGS